MANRRQSGMTLIELMIAVAIVAILAAIAYPSYQRYVARTHRDSAAACLSQYVQVMERYYTTNMRYTDAPDPNLPCSRENNLNQRYAVRLRAGSATATAYTVEAVPTAEQTARDELSCGTLSINNTGTRTPTNNACWR